MLQVVYDHQRLAAIAQVIQTAWLVLFAAK